MLVNENLSAMSVRSKLTKSDSLSGYFSSLGNENTVHEDATTMKSGINAFSL